MVDTTAVASLVEAASRGDEGAWNELVQRYAPLVMSVIRRYRLRDKDAEDVSQTVWLRLVEHLGSIREPRALPMWIITTTRNECLRTLRADQHTRPFDPIGGIETLDLADPAELDEELLRAERHQALRDGLRELPEQQRALLLLLVADPPISYAEISRRLGMPIGSIGPTRARCLDKLRATPAVLAYLDGTTWEDTGGDRHDVAALG